MSLSEELSAVAEAARAFAARGEEIAAVIPAEPALGVRVYLCAFAAGDERAWLALDGSARPVRDRGLVRAAVTIAGLCELAEESAAGGRLAELRSRLDEVARIEGPELVAGATAALAQLEAVLAPPPRVASGAYLDGIGAAARTLEQALGEIGTSPFADAMKAGALAVEGLSAEVEGSYKLLLE